MHFKLRLKGFVFLFIYTIVLFPQENSLHAVNDSLGVEGESKVTSENEIEFNPFKEFIYIIPNAVLQLPPNIYQLGKTNVSLSNFWNLTLITVSTISLMSLDQQTYDRTNSFYNRNGDVKKFEDIAINFGDGKYQLAAAGAFTAYGAVFSNKRAMKTGSNLVEALVSTGLVVQLLKRIFGRESPAASSEIHGEWEPLPGLKKYQKNQAKYYSYPSGHIATTFTAIAVFANNYPEYKWITPAGLAVAGFVGVGLVAKGMHWYSDLPLGASIGYAIGNIVSKKSSASSSVEDTSSHLIISPLFTATATGLNMHYSF